MTLHAGEPRWSPLGQCNQGEIAGVGVGLSFGFVLGRLLAGRRRRQLLDMSRQPSAQDGCPCLGVRIACASSLNETKKATFLSYNGCPKPDAETMALPGKRTPGKAFLDVAAGAAGGVCFACPITDSDGNFLITDRNANPLYDKDTQHRLRDQDEMAACCLL